MKKPLGTYNMITIAFAVVWLALFAMFGYRDIRDGDPGSPTFMLGFLLVIFFAVRYSIKKMQQRHAERLAVEAEREKRHAPGPYPILFFVQDTTGMVPMMETPLAGRVLGVLLILAAAGVVVWLVRRKGAGPKSGRP